MKTKSLTRRAVTLVLLSEVLCAVVLSCTALLHERRLRLRAFDLSLRANSDLLLDAIQDAREEDDPVTEVLKKLSFPRGNVYAVYGQRGELLGTSQTAALVLIERDGEGFRDRRLGGHEYRVFEQQESRTDLPLAVEPGQSGPVTVVYAAPTGHMQHEVFEAARFYSVMSLVILIGTAALLVLLLRKVLEPVGALARAANGISPTTLHFEPPVEALQLRELQPLARALAETIERLRLAFEAQHRFVGDATHELKTAVAVVRSTVQVLSLRPRSVQEYSAGLTRLLEDNSRVEALVSRMLTLARYEESLGGPPVAVNLAESLRGAIARLESFTMAHGIEVTSSLDEHLWVQLAREGAEVLITNLVVNAVQHSRSGSTVYVGLGRSHDDPPRAVLTVQDSGTGISAEALPHVFERFYREDTSRSRETGGAGLGLAICHAIVETAGGRIEVQSTPGQGTTIAVYLDLS